MVMNRRIHMKKSMIAATLLVATSASSAELSLWQVKYKAETNYMDGYTVEGQAYEATGSFEKTGAFISSVRAEVSPDSMSSGLSARDRSIKEIIFEKSDNTIPNIVFESSDIDCQTTDSGDYCMAKGSLSIRGESKPLEIGFWVSDYEGKTWLHSDFNVLLSSYDFYYTTSSAIKVADKIELNIDLIEK